MHIRSSRALIVRTILFGLLLALLGGAVLRGNTASAQGPTPVRIAAADPTAFSVALSEEVFDTAGGSGVTATHAVLGRDDVFADTLAAGPLVAGGPLLYVPGGADGTLPPPVAEELARLLPPGSPVYLAGGVDAVSEDVEDAVDELGYLAVRAGGEERTATAAAIAAAAVRLFEGTSGDSTPDTILVALAGNWPDAIAGASLAASEQFPILLTDGEAASTATTEFLALYPDAEVVVLGGDAAISDDVVADLGADRRLAGPARIDTSVAVAGAFPDDVTGAALINGYLDDGWVEGNAGAVLLQPMLLTGPGEDALPDIVAGVLADRTGGLFVLGGTDQISEAAVDAARAAR